MKPSFASAHMFLKKVDALRTGPAWDYRTIEITGDSIDRDGSPLKEKLEVWLRNPVECIAELLGNSAFDGSISYVPEQVYADEAGDSRVYDEMWTGDWWWDVQVSPTTQPPPFR